jgi:hypothetical protein
MFDWWICWEVIYANDSYIYFIGMIQYKDGYNTKMDIFC